MYVYIYIYIYIYIFIYISSKVWKKPKYNSKRNMNVLILIYKFHHFLSDIQRLNICIYI